AHVCADVGGGRRPPVPRDGKAGPDSVASRREPVGPVAHPCSPFTGRPRLRGGGSLSFTPRAASASRSRHSTWALTLLSSAAALRSTAAHKAGSTRNGYALRSPPATMPL